MLTHLTVLRGGGGAAYTSAVYVLCRPAQTWWKLEESALPLMSHLMTEGKFVALNFYEILCNVVDTPVKRSWAMARTLSVILPSKQISNIVWRQYSHFFLTFISTSINIIILKCSSSRKLHCTPLLSPLVCTGPISPSHREHPRGHARASPWTSLCNFETMLQECRL